MYVHRLLTCLLTRAAPQDKNNPLDVSPANTDVSEQKGDRTEHAEREGSRERTSGGSSPRKGSQVS